MKRIVYILLFFLIKTHSISAQNYKNAIKKAQLLIEAHKSQTQIPGCQIAVMVKGKLVWSQSFGYNDLENKIEVNSTTKFRIASVSKPMTAIALGKLIDAKKIDIDTNIRTYLPEYPQKKHKITARQLATSTSGIRHYNATGPQFNTNNYKNIFEALEGFQNDELLFEPETRYLYSSFGWVLLSAVMDKASKTFFFDVMQNTWDDLGMTNTTFDFPNKPIEQKSKFYIYDKKQQRKLAPYENRSYMYALGGYLSTAEDLTQMGNHLINSDFLPKKTEKILTKSHKLKDSTLTFYGLGWETGVSRLKTKVIYQSGSLPTSIAHLIIYPDEDVVFAYLANTGDNVFFNAREAQTIAELFIQAKQLTDNQNKNIVVIWYITTRSLRDKKIKGTLNISLKNDGILCGTINFKRSRKKISCPIVITTIESNSSLYSGFANVH